MKQHRLSIRASNGGSGPPDLFPGDSTSDQPPIGVKPLSIVQSEYLRAIIKFTNENGFPPARKEIPSLIGRGYHYGRSPVYILEQKGYVRLSPNRAAGIVILKNELGQPMVFRGYEVACG